MVSHSPCGSLHYTLQSHVFLWFFFMGLQNLYTHTLRPGFRFSLAMHIFGLHSPSRCWIFKVFLFSKYFFHGIFILSLSDQVLGSHSQCAYLIDTPSRYWILIFLFNFSFSILIFHGAFILSLSKQVVRSHSLCRCWILKFLLIFFSIWKLHHVSHLLYYHSPSRL